jgi:hypothetical protein
MEHVRISKFEPSNKTHRHLSDLSALCHAATGKDGTDEVKTLETKIDKAAAKLWGITDEELKAIQEALAETGRGKRAADTDEIGERDGSE